ncbi:glucose dehydrogenase [FAD, quinone]-like [Thrips palmi]|uniref:Glucose dehydrogenase [FAD, quinone]-like n=1 Tax=Thrips palmi TaxID=161013 RepID=A0A6P8YZQ3_THRPL|nr:glucose dehydrogenase [FAD, quinone]-like [Thrips palmi]
MLMQMSRAASPACDNDPLYTFVTVLATVINSRLQAERTARAQEQPGPDDDVADVVVVGGGSAGCIVAARLSEDPRVRVTLLERGGTEPPEARVPAFLSYLTARANVMEFLQAQPEKGNCNGTGCVFPLPSLLSGGGGVNGMLYVRGSSVDYDDWAEQVGDLSWGYSSVLRYFKRAERNLDKIIALDRRFHGRRGRQPVSWHPYRGPVLQRLADAFQAAGLPFRRDVNARGQLGYSVVQTTTQGGERVSSFRAYLGPALRRRNLRVVTYATVTRVLVEPTANTEGDALPRATGVEYMDAAGRLRVVKAEKEVVLTAGALNTPKILLLSGIGPAEHLKAFNISLMADLPVGQGLQDQSRAGGLVFDCDASLCVSDWEHRVDDLEEYDRHRNGTLSATPGQITAFVRTGVDPPPPLGRGRPAKQPDLQIMVSGSRNDPNGCVVLDRWRSNRFTFMPAVLHPRSRGEVRLRSSDPLQPPLVRFGFFSDDGNRDLAVYKEGLKLVLAMEPRLAERGFTLNRDPGQAPACAGLPFGSDAWQDCLARTTTGTTWHYAASCRMGRDGDAGAVLDTGLRVRGVQGLRVADASAMPSTTSGNTNAPVMMVAERAADLIKKDHGFGGKPCADDRSPGDSGPSDSEDSGPEDGSA